MGDLVGAILERKRGDTAPDAISVIDPATGGPRDITGYVYVLTLHELPDPTDEPAAATINGVITSATGGTVEFLWTEEQADRVPALYYYDIQQTDETGRIKTIAKSRYRFWQDITK